MPIGTDVVVRREVPISVAPAPEPPATGAGQLPPPPPPAFTGMPLPRWCPLPALGWQTRQSRPMPAPTSVQPAPVEPVGALAMATDLSLSETDVAFADDQPVATPEPAAADDALPEPAVAAEQPVALAGVARHAARWVAFAIVGAATWLLVLTTLPRLAGWQPTVITGRSMEPAIARGDVVIVRPAPDGALLPGAVVTFEDPNRPGHLITHRVIERRTDGSLRTKGDNNRDADPAAVAASTVTGRAVLRVPYAGRPVVWAMDGRWLPLAATAGVLGVAIRTAFRPAGTARRRPRRSWRRAAPAAL